MLAHMLVSLEPPDFPVALGVIYADPAPSFDYSVHKQIEMVTAERGKGDLGALMRGGRTWTVN